MRSFGLLAFEEENMDAVSISRRTSIQAGSILGGSNSGAPQIGGSTTLWSHQLVFLF